MTDPKIYTALLRLQHPWYISRIEVDVKAEEAHVFIDHHHGQLPWSTFGTLCNVRDHGDERVWRQCMHAQLGAVQRQEAQYVLPLGGIGEQRRRTQRACTETIPRFCHRRRHCASVAAKSPGARAIRGGSQPRNVAQRARLSARMRARRSQVRLGHFRSVARNAARGLRWLPVRVSGGAIGHPFQLV